MLQGKIVEEFFQCSILTLFYLYEELPFPMVFDLDVFDNQFTRIAVCILENNAVIVGTEIQ